MEYKSGFAGSSACIVSLALAVVRKGNSRLLTTPASSLPVAENLLEQNFVADAPDRVWLTDITYILTDEGWLYLAGHKDICTGEIVGYAMSNRMAVSFPPEKFGCIWPATRIFSTAKSWDIHSCTDGETPCHGVVIPCCSHRL